VYYIGLLRIAYLVMRIFYCISGFLAYSESKHGWNGKAAHSGKVAQTKAAQ
jgi:hypothetical protein